MKQLIIGVLKSVFSEDVLKAIVLALGDHLVASSKNRLDDAVWKKIKKEIKKFSG